jgi:thiamine pyrophosphate-dependent acetolactate synthase large subunit-like protein
MTHHDALAILHAHRPVGSVVVATMGSGGLWPSFSDTPLDFCYLPSSMGQGVPLGLGLALARPGRRVIVLCGDGGLLMNLGCLVTLGDHPTAAVTVVLIDNGLYEVTGGQPRAGQRVDFAGLARAAGVPRMVACLDRESWSAAAAEMVSGEGPTFAWLTVEGRYGQKTPTAPRPMAEQVLRLQQALRG